MEKEANIHAFIDGNNLHKGVASLGWQLDYRRFRVLLKDRYNVSRAFIFLGYMEENSELYRGLEDAGYTVVFREIAKSSGGLVKANCDVLMTWELGRQLCKKTFGQAILITGDGDFAEVAVELLEADMLHSVIAPNVKECSYLLRRRSVEFRLTWVEEIRRFVEATEEPKSEKAPDWHGNQ